MHSFHIIANAGLLHQTKESALQGARRERRCPYRNKTTTYGIERLPDDSDNRRFGGLIISRIHDFNRRLKDIPDGG